MTGMGGGDFRHAALIRLCRVAGAESLCSRSKLRLLGPDTPERRHARARSGRAVAITALALVVAVGTPPEGPGRASGAYEQPPLAGQRGGSAGQPDKTEQARNVVENARGGGEIEGPREQGEVTIAQVLRDRATFHSMLGDVQREQGDLKSAAESYGKALQIFKGLADADPTSATAQRDLAVSYDRLGDVHVAQGDLESAAESYAKALQICKRLADADPTSAVAQRDLAASYQNLRLLCRARAWEQARSIAERRRLLGEAREWAERELRQWRAMKVSGVLAPPDEPSIDLAQRAIDEIDLELARLRGK
ncbi:MAG: tetratricopeptide repeat protein [Phycisphaerales bacterium]|nr:tetratricopeptide repeat protein [Phycisphaerales bacterium]